MYIYIIGGISRPILSNPQLLLSWHSIKELAAATETKKPVSRRGSLNLHVKSSGNSTLVPGHRRVRHVSRGRTMVVGMTRKFQNLNIPSYICRGGTWKKGGRRKTRKWKRGKVLAEWLTGWIREPNENNLDGQSVCLLLFEFGSCKFTGEEKEEREGIEILKLKVGSI